METSANPSSPKPLPTKVRLTTAGPQAQTEELADEDNAAITPPPKDWHGYPGLKVSNEGGCKHKKVVYHR